MGAGVVELNADSSSTFTGNVQLNAGVELSLGHKGALGAGTFFFNGGTLKTAAQFTGANAITTGVSLGGNVSVNSAFPVEFAGDWAFFTASPA